MDIKLASGMNPAWRPNFPEFFNSQMSLLKRHEKFLSVAPDKTYVKIVLTQKTRIEEFTQTLDLLKNFPQVPLVILQPVTELNGFKTPEKNQLDIYWRLAWEKLPQPVRLLPQYHRVWQLA